MNIRISLWGGKVELGILLGALGGQNGYSVEASEGNFVCDPGECTSTIAIISRGLGVFIVQINAMH